MTLAARTAHFAANCSGPELNDRPEIKMHMVKPTPPRTPTQSICPHVAPSGRGEKPIFTLSAVTAMMPMGLPKTRPKKQPRATGSLTTLAISTPTSLSWAFAKAKSGRMIKLTGVAMVVSTRCSGGVTRCMMFSTRLAVCVNSC